MASFRDLRRLVNGLSLVADELLKSSQAIHAAKSGDLPTLISSSLKKALVSATDLAGITKGKVREFSYPSPKETVVHFSDHSDRRDESVVFDSQTSSSIKDEVVEAELESLDEKIEEIGFELDKSEEGRLEALREQHDVDIGSLIEKSEIDSKDLRENADTSEIAVAPVTKRKPRERRVPSTPFSRAFGFAGLGAQLMVGTAQDYATKLLFGTPASEENQPGYSAFLSKRNAERLALALCRMRGAALKLGQMLSIQDESLVPAPILSALEIVRQGADVMPRSQLNQVLSSELGPDWPSKLRSFDYEPMAAASIGQVHRAVTKDGLDVAIKIQYPGVADSIESDLENVRRLLNYTNLIPKGLYLDRAMKVAKEELSRECNYELEATSQKRFRELLCDTEGFYVPVVIDDISSRKVLTTELVSGIPIDKVTVLNQETRDYVGKKLLELTLKELFLFRFMQTDPNWSNFLYDDAARMINLIDFGAAREYPQGFVDDYLRMVLACANCDRDGVIQMSQRLGFLTGMESEVMLEAHVQAGFIIGMPFSKPGGYNFRLSNITNSISTLGATMLKHRLSPPPDEAYSLHRKLSGAFLACIKLGAVVPCRDVLLEVYEQYQYIDHGAEVVLSSTA